MKKSFKRLIIFSLIIILIMFLNSFVLKLFNRWTLFLFTVILLIITKKVFGYEKDRHRYVKDIVLEIIIFLMTFFILYYLSGIFISFAKVGNYLTFKSIKNIILPVVLYILAKEYLRYTLITKAGDKKGIIALIIVAFICMDCTIAMSISSLSFSKQTFLLLALTIIPTITENILCSWMTYYFGYIPSLVYLMIMYLYKYLLPIVPNPNEYLYSIIFFILPVLLILRLYNWLKKDKTEAIVLEHKNAMKLKIVYEIPIILILIMMIYFVSGYFKFYAIAIATGSMVPNINKGDVVIINKEFKEKDLEVGKVIAYNYNDKVVVHRIYKEVKIDKELIIYTKGDANSNMDEYKITKDMIIGIVNKKIPWIGYPTVMINEIW